jgi:hypothetical protein
VVSEPDRQLLVNVRWLAGYRDAPADPDGERSRMTSLLAVERSTIAALLAGAREPALARLLHELSDQDLFRDRRARREAVRQAVINEQRRTQKSTAKEPSVPGPPELDGWSGIEIPTLGLER